MTVQVVQVVQANPYCTHEKSSFRLWKEERERHNKETPGPRGPPSISGQNQGFEDSVDTSALGPPAESSPTPPSKPTPTAGNGWLTENPDTLPRCKRCDEPIIWGEVKIEFGKAENPNQKWMPLDPDGMPHGCH